MTHGKIMAIALGAVVAGSMLWPVEAQAQHRRAVVRAAPRTSVAVGVGVGGVGVGVRVGSPYYYRYYRPYYYGAYYYRPWYYGFYGHYGYPWAYGYPYGYGPYGYYGPVYDGASLRLQVEPKQTEVYIDGYWAGTVDDFDGFFQRLRLEPGEHDVELYLDGHRSVKQKVYLQPNGTFRIRHTMTPLGPGDTPDPRPTSPPRTQPQPRGRYDAFGRPEPREAPERPEPREAPERPEPREAPEPPEPRAPFGTLAIRVQPRDADVFVDGESWDGPDSSERLVIELPEGEHRIEVRKDGFTTYASTVRIRQGETRALNVSLARE